MTDWRDTLFSWKNPPVRDLKRELDLAQYRNPRNLRQFIAAGQTAERSDPMDNDQLTRIEKMLDALLKNNNQVHWIGGFVYGRTSNDDPFVILYPASDRLKEKTVRVYDHDFRKLPTFINTADVPADTENNPSKDQATKKGIYHTCPKFKVVIYDGKETQMGAEKRFGDVLYVTQQAPLPSGRPTQPPPPAPDLFTPRDMMLQAKTAENFDKAAYDALQNGVYAEQSHITKARQAIDPNWQPGQRNEAMFTALKKYQEARKTAGADKEALKGAMGQARELYEKVKV